MSSGVVRYIYILVVRHCLLQDHRGQKANLEVMEPALVSVASAAPTILVTTGQHFVESAIHLHGRTRQDTTPVRGAS